MWPVVEFLHCQAHFCVVTKSLPEVKCVFVTGDWLNGGSHGIRSSVMYFAVSIGIIVTLCYVTCDVRMSILLQWH